MADDQTRPSGINVGGLVWGLLFAGAAVVGLTGSFEWVFSAGTKWIVASVIAVVGLALLISALPGRKSDT